MVEFALVVPILCVVLFGVFQFGALYNDYVTLTDATRVGARKARCQPARGRSGRRRGDSGPELAPAVSTPAKLTVNVTSTGWQHGDSVTVEATLPLQDQPPGCRREDRNLKSKTTERVE